MNKIYNFSAGPACLSEQALVASNKAIKNFKGSGVSLLDKTDKLMRSIGTGFKHD